MGYYVIYKDILIKDNNKLILLESGECNNVGPKYKDNFKFKVFNDETDYLNYVNKFTDMQDQFARVNGKFISSYQYGMKLKRLLNKVNSVDDYYFSIRQLLGYENKENNLFLNPDEFKEINIKINKDPDLMNKYRELTFNTIGKDLTFKDLVNDLKYVKIKLMGKKG